MDEDEWARRRIRELEGRLQKVEQALGLAPPPTAEEPWMAEVRRLIEEGKAIHAIKIVRQETGADLAEAQRVVDSLT